MVQTVVIAKAHLMSVESTALAVQYSLYLDRTLHSVGGSIPHAAHKALDATRKKLWLPVKQTLLEQKAVLTMCSHMPTHCCTFKCMNASVTHQAAKRGVVCRQQLTPSRTFQPNAAKKHHKQQASAAF